MSYLNYLYSDPEAVEDRLDYLYSLDKPTTEQAAEIEDLEGILELMEEY